MVRHLVPRKVCLFERLWNLQEMGSPWWKWIATGRFLTVTHSLDSSVLSVICHSEQPLPPALTAADQVSHHVFPTARGPNALKPGAKVAVPSVDCSWHYLFIIYCHLDMGTDTGCGCSCCTLTLPCASPSFSDSTASRCFP